MMVLLKNECSLSGGDTQPLHAVNFFSNFLHSQVVRMQKLWALLLALVPIMSRLVKLSLPSIFKGLVILEDSRSIYRDKCLFFKAA